MYKYLVGISRGRKILALLTLDLFLICCSIFLALVLRVSDLYPIEWLMKSLSLVVVMLTSTVIFTFVLKLHRKKLGNYDFRFATDLALLVTLVSIIGFIANYYTVPLAVPRTTPIIAGAIAYTLMLYARYFILYVLDLLKTGTSKRTRVAIYGAGAMGAQLAMSLRSSTQYKPIIFVDDNPHMQGLNIAGLKVCKLQELIKTIKSGKIEEILLAIPTASVIQRRKAIRSISGLGCKISEIPSYEEIIKSGNLPASLKAVDSDELLGRSKVKIELEISAIDYKGANIMVSGGGGSIGAELCRQILKIAPKTLVILDISELNLYIIEQELAPVADKLGIKLVLILGSVGNKELITQTLKEHKIKAVLHAAAYKHIPLVEQNIIQGIENNVFGTKNFAELAALHGVERFTLISSDKAVRPSSVMGATKRLAELILQELDEQQSHCTFSMVRFGNVLGSSGSVIPHFKKQIEQGGPVTVTHKDMTRYFMTISEASQLVILASSFAQGGEVFVLDMGEPIKIIDLAERIILLSGYTIKNDNNPDGDIEIEVGSIRKGEKLHEQILISNDNITTDHPAILYAKESKLSSIELESVLKKLNDCLKNYNADQAKKVLFDTINKSLN